ncbi:MAG: Fe-S protein assembly chaperone HscA [Gammaproteobacteria bacterium]|nr:MAG: Fe-S protein assembly chaperone HscA [Gammaproteobacteria bacterium]
MALLQISEQGQSLGPHQYKRAVGIDLGTTNSLIATVKSGAAEILLDGNNHPLLPSIVHYGSAGICVGEDVGELTTTDPQNTIVSVKRFMGRSKEDCLRNGGEQVYQFADNDGGMVSFVTRAGKISPVEVSAEILRTLALRAEQALGGSLDGAVITVPAYFDDAQRQATKDAALLAGIKVLRLLNEPTAAAIAYGLGNADSGLIAIYDLGGGTFDMSVLRLSRGVFDVLATGGDTALGGDDFDFAIATWLRGQAAIDGDLSPQQQRILLATAREAREALTIESVTSVAYQGWQGQLDRQQLNKCIDSLVDRTLRASKKALRDAGIDRDELTAVVMVGGTTRMPRVREKVAEFFGRSPLVDIDPDTVVAMGAARQAEVLVGNKPGDEMLLLDVIPLSLGVETMGGLVEKIIHRNTTIPVAKAQEFTTFKDGQTALAIHIVQGERELVSDCRSLARLELKGIPPMAAGSAKIRIGYQVDADGLLNVTARELTSGVEARVEVKPSYGLGDGEISKMLQDSIDHSTDDVRLRALREQQVEVDRLLEDLASALARDGTALLDKDEFHCLETGLAELSAVRQHSTDHRELARHVESLSQLSENFAALRMDVAIKGALAGHHLDDFDGGV